MLSKCLLNVVQRKKKIVSGPLLIINLGDMNLRCGVKTVHMGKEEVIFCSGLDIANGTGNDLGMQMECDEWTGKGIEGGIPSRSKHCARKLRGSVDSGLE